MFLCYTEVTTHNKTLNKSPHLSFAKKKTIRRKKGKFITCRALCMIKKKKVSGRKFLCLFFFTSRKRLFNHNSDVDLLVWERKRKNVGGERGENLRVNFQFFIPPLILEGFPSKS